MGVIFNIIWKYTEKTNKSNLVLSTQKNNVSFIFCFGCLLLIPLDKYSKMESKSISPINLDDDLGIIIKAKMKRHEEQIKYHQLQLKELGEYLKKGVNGHSTSGSTSSKSDYDKQWYWESALTKLLTNVLANKEFKNSDVMEIEKVPNLDDEEVKKKVRYAISMALAAFVKKGILTSRKKSGMKGYLYKKR